MKDLAEYWFINLLIWACGILSIALGSKHLGIYGNNFTGGVVLIFGLLLLFIQFEWMENKIHTSQVKRKREA